MTEHGQDLESLLLAAISLRLGGDHQGCLDVLVRYTQARKESPAPIVMYRGHPWNGDAIFRDYSVSAMSGRDESRTD